MRPLSFRNNKLGDKHTEKDSAPFIIQEQQTEWVIAQRQILRPLSFRNNKLGGKHAETDFVPFIIQEPQVGW